MVFILIQTGIKPRSIYSMGIKPRAEGLSASTNGGLHKSGHAPLLPERLEVSPVIAGCYREPQLIALGLLVC